MLSLGKVLIVFHIGFHGVLLVIMEAIQIISVTGLSNILKQLQTLMYNVHKNYNLFVIIFLRNHLECPVADCVCRCYSLDSTSRYCSV